MCVIVCGGHTPQAAGARYERIAAEAARGDAGVILLRMAVVAEAVALPAPGYPGGPTLLVPRRCQSPGLPAPGGAASATTLW